MKEGKGIIKAPEHENSKRKGGRKKGRKLEGRKKDLTEEDLFLGMSRWKRLLDRQRPIRG